MKSGNVKFAANGLANLIYKDEPYDAMKLYAEAMGAGDMKYAPQNLKKIGREFNGIAMR